MNYQVLKSKLDQKKGKREALIQHIRSQEDILKEAKRDLRNSEDAQLIVQMVAQQTQAELEYNISDIVTTALDAVFEEAYEFKIEFVQRRNKTEAEIFFVRDNNRVNPMDAAGGGVVDIAAFALRLALWLLRIILVISFSLESRT